MASWREIERVRKNPREFKAIAAHVLTTYGGALREWEEAFLEGISSWSAPDITNRQCEKLLQIRDDALVVTEWRKFNLHTLLQKCFEARLDLTESDEEWVVFLKSQPSIRKRHVNRLVSCARFLGFIEEELEEPISALPPASADH